MQKLKEILLKSSIMLLILTPLFSNAQNIYWLESNFNSPRLVKADSNGVELLSLALPVGSLPQSIVLNTENNQLYWTGLPFIKAQIKTVSNSFNSSYVIIDGQSVLRGITLDPENGKLYWVSTNLVDGPKIWQSELNGQSQTVLIDFGPGSNSTPRCIALDTDAKHIYWTNFGAGKIQRADIAPGAVPEDIISGLNGPFGIDIDAISAKIYWTEMNGQKIKSADLDGNNISLLLDDLSYPNQISVNNTLNKMAWTEMGSSKIKTAALDGSGIMEYKVNAKAATGILIEPPAGIIVSGGDLQVLPKDTTIELHSYLQYQAQFVDSNGATSPTSADWFVKRDRVGPINNDGLLFSYFPGKANIMAKKDSQVAKAKLMVIDSTTDSSGTNYIYLTRKFKGYHDKKGKILKEGQLYTIAGLPSPFNIIDGSKLYFPKGSLHENIKIEVELPRFCKVKKDSIGFPGKIINGIKFNVFASDSLIEPFYFDRPISISIPFKRGLLKKHGIKAEHLSLFYAIDSTTFDSAGISHVVVDSTNNRIYALIEHFSSLVIKEKDITNVTNDIKQDADIPDNFELMQNYPNPFNPITTISYNIKTFPGTSQQVNLSIYNLMGQKVATLVNKRQEPGNYMVQWDAGNFASGVYVYTLKAGKGFKQSKKLILLK